MLRRRLERELGHKLPDYVWEDADLQDLARAYKDAVDDWTRQGEWDALTAAASRLMAAVERAWADGRAKGRVEALEGVSKGLGTGLEQTPSSYSTGYKDEGVNIAPGFAVSRKTDAMTRAMSELFAGLAHRHPAVVAFREDTLGRFLTQDEAHALLASPAARMFPPEWFAEWEIPVIGHSAIIETQEMTSSADTFDHRVTVHVTPPGVTKKVRYADPRLLSPQEEDREGYRTRCMAQGGASLPPVYYIAAEQHGEHWYPRWLWPGSVVGNLFNLSDELVTTFDWPADGFGQLATNVGAWFVLTGEAPDVRPLDARWEQKRGKHLPPQWRVRLTTPPWLPPDEVLRAYVLMRQRMFEGRIRVPDQNTLEAARFVWEQERQNGYERPSWPELFKRWNAAYPEAAYKSYNNFRTVCMRGIKAVLRLNLTSPR